MDLDHLHPGWDKDPDYLAMQRERTERWLHEHPVWRLTEAEANNLGIPFIDRAI